MVEAVTAQDMQRFDRYTIEEIGAPSSAQPTSSFEDQLRPMQYSLVLTLFLLKCC